MPASELTAITAADKRVTVGERVPRRRNHKAAEQIAAMRGDKVAIDRVAQDKDRADKFLRGASAGINAMPVMDFSEEGAG